MRAVRSALFVPCLTGAVFSADVSAQRRLLALAGFADLEALPAFCCGQPAATAGDAAGGEAMARSWAERAAPYDAVFVASATCCGHLRTAVPAADVRYAPDLWVDAIRERSTRPCARIYLHRPCHDVWDDAGFARYRAWVEETAAVETIDRPFGDPCCGFGGVFATLFDRTAGSMMAHRMGAIAAAGATAIVSAEPGCLSHFAAHAAGIPVVPLATYLVARGIG